MPLLGEYYICAMRQVGRSITEAASEADMAVDVQDWSRDPRGRLQLYRWHGGANQRFTFTAQHEGLFTVRNVHSGLVIDVKDWSTNNGAVVHQYADGCQANQLWKPSIPAVHTPILITSRHSGNALSSTYQFGSHRPSATVQLQSPSTATGDTSQLWLLVPCGDRVQVWRTSGDQQHLLHAQGSLPWTPLDGSNEGWSVEVKPKMTYQVMDGFGAALSESAACNISAMPADARFRLMKRLFSFTDDGIGLSVIRVPMSASDFSTGDWTCNDSPSPDTNLQQFDIQRLLQHSIPLLQQAKQLNSHLKIILSPWSAPAWMKRGSRILKGGALRENCYEVYARLFVRVIQEFELRGLFVYAVTIQNEPFHATANYPCMGMSAEEQATFIGHFLGPELARCGVSTKILCWDHNWDNVDFPTTVLRHPVAAPFVAGTAWHAYNGTVQSQSTVHDRFPGKETHFTEICGCTSGNFAADLKWHMRNIVIGAVKHWARSVVYWNLALDEHSGPRNGGAGTVRGVLTIHSRTFEVTYSPEFWAMAHTSRFVRAGALRIDVVYGGEDVIAVAYRNEDGSTVVVVSSQTNRQTTVTVVCECEQFNDTLDSGDVKTYVW